MSLTNPDKVVTEERLAEFYQQILPYLGGMPDVMMSKFSKSDIYSTGERMVGIWTDGKPLYQKSVTQSINATEAWNTILSLGTTCNIVDIRGLFTRSDNGYAIPIGTSVALSGRFNLCGNYPNVGDFSVSNEEAGTINVTLQYTKTTDSPVAVGDANDYSTTEKIVGTWIDGKPVWQKTVTQSNVSDNTILDISGLSADTIMSVNGFCVDPNNNVVPIDYYYDSGNRISYWINAAKTQLQWHLKGSAKTITLTIQYTKTSS